MTPNVLVVLTDQQTATAMSCAGNPYLATPALDALAARGTRFTRAHCTQPLCTPSRASMLTGRMPTELGVTVNAGRLTGVPAEQQLGRVFTAAGYDCGYAGKWHVPELAVPAGAGFRRVHGESEDRLVADCAAFLAEPRDRPYLLVASLTEPHGICQWARGQTPPSGDVSDVDSAGWPPLPPNFAIGGYDAELPRIAQARSPHSYPTAGWDEDRWRRYRFAYHRLCERADAQVGRLLELVDEDTVVVFSADHGDQAGAHRWNQKWVLHAESVEVPLIVAAPDGRRGATSDALVSVGLDLLPTLCDYAGIVPPQGIEGRSLRPVVTAGTPDGWRDTVYAETEWEVPGVQHLTGRMVRTDRFRYVCYAWGRHREQLYDLHADPGELTNLAPVGSYAGVLADHRRRLAAHAAGIGDRFTRFVPAADAPFR